jgi:ribosomal 30S subunit maturation factor RimM
LAVDYLGQELHIPYHEDIVKQVDDKKKRIAVQLPPGFIEAMR